MFGWTGKILCLDLSKKQYTTLTPNQNIYDEYIGGRGLAGYYLKEVIKEPWDSEKMRLLFFTGPLTDTPSPTSGRMTIMSRSPLTGTICDSSVGGTLGGQIKKAGWDGLIITGKSQNMIGIEIIDSSINFIDTSNLKGSTISEVISKFEKNSSTAIIGPAAENGVLFSNIVLDSHHFAGRGGLGLVMANKNIKYIKVKGTGKTSVFDINELRKAREKIFRLTAASPILLGELGISNYGTGALYDLMDSRNMMPTDNFKATKFNYAPKLNAYQYKNKYEPKKTGCPGCHILCKKIGKNNEILPEFETMSHFTALIGNKDLDTVVKANNICNEMGMDTISAAATLACYSEIKEKIITKEKILSLLYDIALSKGIGKELKLGSYRYAELKGQEEAAMTVKKQELPAYDPRGAYGMALSYATSTRSGCHLRAYPISHEILRKPVATDRFTFNGKARIIKISEDLNAVIDSLTTCKFLFFAATLEEYAQVFYAVTGIKTTAQDLLKKGERIYYNEYTMNALNGFTSKDNDLPKRFFKNPGTSTIESKIKPLKRKDFLKCLKDYYKIRGLDKNGLPTKKETEKLGIEWKD